MTNDASCPSKTRWRNIETLWKVSEKWFRIIEYSLILGILSFVNQKINSIAITILYYISWGAFAVLLMEAGEYVAERYYETKQIKSSRTRWVVWTLSMFSLLLFWTVIRDAGELISFLLNKK